MREVLLALVSLLGGDIPSNGDIDPQQHWGRMGRGVTVSWSPYSLG